MHFMKDPDTGKRASRMNPLERWITEDLLALRIIGQALWDQIQVRLADIRKASGAKAADRPAVLLRGPPGQAPSDRQSVPRLLRRRVRQYRARLSRL